MVVCTISTLIQSLNLLFIILLDLEYDEVIALRGVLLVIYFVIWLCEANTTPIEYIWTYIGVFARLPMSYYRKVWALLKHWLFNSSFLIESVLGLFELFSRKDRYVPILLDLVSHTEFICENVQCSEILIIVYFLGNLVILNDLLIIVLI